MKVFVITLAVFSLFALRSEGIIRKCIPVTAAPPTPAPTPAPTTTTTTTTTTATTTTPTTKSPVYQCALWARYIGDDAPTFNGFSAGIAAITNTTAYVGFGMYLGNRLPARIQITTTTIGTSPKTPGGYISWGAEHQVKHPEYLVVPESCTCQWLAPKLASSSAGLVLTGDIADQFAVGRKTFAGGRVSITRVITDSTDANYMKQWYNTAAGAEVKSELATELLVCESTEPTDTQPIINFKPNACGVWSSINMVNSVVSNGFAVGPSRIPDVTAYVGRGHWNDEYRIGRYQNEAVTGAYTSASGDKLMSYSTWLVVPENCTCKWMSSYQAIVRAGLVTAPDQDINFAVGLRTFPGDITTVSRINPTNFQEWFNTPVNKDSSDTRKFDGEALVCDALPHPSTNPCDLWMTYKKDAAPTVNGFSAGVAAFKTANNTQAYVARAFINDWLLPGRVQINGNTGVIHLTAGNEPITNSGTGEYLVIRDGCSCRWEHPSIASNCMGLVRTGEQWGGEGLASDDYPICRVKEADGRVSVGLVKTPYFWGRYTNPVTGAETALEMVPEVLVCDSQSDMSTRPTLDFGNKACALWSRYKPDGNSDWPATHGFSFGLDRFGNAGYVGRGEIADTQFIGRVQITGTPGVYLTTSDEPFGNLADYVVVPNNCSCQWITYTTAVTKIGLIRSIHYDVQFAVGRVSLGGGKFAISSVNTVNRDQNYVNLTGGLVTNTKASELLVCETP